MARLNLALIVKTVDQATRPLKQIQRTVRTVGRQTGLDKVGRDLRRVGRQMGRVGRQAGVFARRFGLATGAAGAAAFAFGGQYATTAFNLQQKSKLFGVPIEKLQELRYAAEQAGIDTNTFDMAFQRFTRRTAEAAAGTGEALEALKFLGIALKDSAGNVRPAADLFAEVADKMKGIEDESLKVRIGFKLFDSEGAKMVLMLADGKKGLEAHAKELRKLGIISEEEAKQAASYHLEKLQLGAAIRGVGYAIGAVLLPKLAPLIKSTREWIAANRIEIVTRFKTAIEELAEMVSWLGDRFDELISTGARFLNWIRETFPPADRLIAKLVTWAEELGWVKGAAILLGTFLGGGLIRAVIGLFKPLASLVFSIAGAGAKMLWLVGKPIATMAYGLAVTVARKAVPAAVAAFRGLNAALRANPFIAIGTAVVGAAYLIYRNWDDIVEFFERIIPKLRGVLLGWWEGINDYWAGFWANTVAAVGIDEWLFKLVGYKDRFFAAVTGWWSGIIEWVRAKWQAITDLIPDFLKREIGIDVAGPASGGGASAPVPAAAPPDLPARSAAEAARWTVASSSTSATRRPARESPASKTAPTKSRWTLTPGS